MQLRLTTQCESRGKASRPGPAAAAVIIHNAANGKIMLATGFYLGKLTPEQADFRGLLRGIEAAQSLGGEELQVLHTNGDVIALVTGAEDTDDPEVEPVLAQVQMALLRFELWQLRRTDSVYTGQRVELIEQAIQGQRDIVGKTADSETMPPLSQEEAQREKQQRAAAARAEASPPSAPPRPRESTTPAAAPSPIPTPGDGEQADASSSDQPRESQTPVAAESPLVEPVEPGEWRDVEGPSVPLPQAEKRCPRFDVQLAQPPGDDCPQAMDPDQWFRFGPGTPEGVCVYAAREVLNQTLFAQGQTPQWLAECPRCGVWLQIARVE